MSLEAKDNMKHNLASVPTQNPFPYTATKEPGKCRIQKSHTLGGRNKAKVPGGRQLEETPSVDHSNGNRRGKEGEGKSELEREWKIG